MRLPGVMTFVLAVVVPALGQPVATTTDLSFMTGCWKFEAKGRVVEEQWMTPSGGSLLGMSRTVVNGKTTEFEFLQIRDLPEGLAFIAKPSGQAEATFVAVSTSAGEVVFENQKHDFPQRIRYRASGDALHARVEGTMNGKARGFDIPYTRAKCAP